MAFLILRRNGLIQPSQLIDELWSTNPPKSSMTTLQTYIYKLRKMLSKHDAGDALTSQAGGYMLAIPEGATDVHEFEHKAAEGQRRLKEGAVAQASELFSSALAHWRGPTLADIPLGSLLSPYVTRLEELRCRTLELRIEADLQLGYHRELNSELKSLVLTYPLNEQFHRSLMISLYRSGRRNEALEVYRGLRDKLIEEIGLEPGEELRELHQDLLLDKLPRSSALELPPTDTPPALIITESPEGIERKLSNTGERTSPPAQLPAPVTGFTGRGATVETIYENLSPRRVRDIPTTSRITVITGAPGVGKTALALHAAHWLREEYPDGQLHAELTTAGGTVDAGTVLYGFLHALGIPEHRIPADRDERSQLFRSETAGRRLLLVIDEVPSSSVALPLLPGGLGCAVLITGRQRLHGLVDAQKIELDGLSADEGIDLIAHMTQGFLTAEERAAAARLVELASGIPLLLRGISTRLSMTPGLSLTALANKLESVSRHQLLEEFRVRDLDLRSRYDCVYASLSSREQSAFRFLSLLPRNEFTALSTAQLFGWDLESAKRVLDVLADHHLIRIVGCADAVAIYSFPKLIAGYAHEQLNSILSQPDHPEAAGENGPYAIPMSSRS